MALQFSTTDQESQAHGIKMLVYGKSGAGKTKLAATAPYPIILSAESGLLSLRGVRIPTIKITNIQDLIDAQDWCYRAPQAQQFQTVYIDSISEIGEVVLANAKLLVKDPRQAYGELIEKMLMTLKSFRDLPNKHVVMAAKQEAIKDEQTGIVSYGPAMPGNKLGPQLPYLFDEVLRIAVNKTPQGEKYHFIQTAPDLQYDAKDRSGALDAVEPPDLTHIFNKILGVR